MALDFTQSMSITMYPGHTQYGVKHESYGHRPQILANVEHQWSVGVVVDASAGVQVGSKKVVKAGTPLTGSLDDRTTAFTKASGAASGVLLHDVDVTEGNNNGTMLVFGFVNTNRLDDDVKALITDAVKTSLGMIRFLAC